MFFLGLSLLLLALLILIFWGGTSLFKQKTINLPTNQEELILKESECLEKQ